MKGSRIELLIISALLIVACQETDHAIQNQIVQGGANCKTKILVEWPADVSSDTRKLTWAALFDIGSKFFLDERVPLNNTIFSHPDIGEIEIRYSTDCQIADSLTLRLSSEYTKYMKRTFNMKIPITLIPGTPYDASVSSVLSQ